MRASGVMIALIALIAFIAPERADAQTRPLTGLDRYIEQAMSTWGVPGLAVAVVKDDSVIYARGFGVREMGKPDRVDANTIFAIASTTKAFTSALIGMLVDEKKVRWDDAVALHYPGFRLADPYVTYELTLRDILSHRSGLPRGDYLWYLSPHDRGEVIRRLRFLDPATSFRSAYGYQNIMFLTAGQVAEAVTKESWDAALGRRIFTPLGMRSTSTSVSALRGVTNVAVAHDRIEGAIQPVRWPNYDNLAGAGAMNSSVSDMAQWLRMQLGHGMYKGARIISDSVIKEMHTPQTVIRMSKESEEMFPETHFVAYGLGWSLRDYRGRKLVGHGGVLDGMRTEVLMMPEERAGVVVMANLDGTNLPNAIAYRVMDSFLGEPVKDWSTVYLAAHTRARVRADSAERAVRADRVEGTQPRLELGKYAGTYADSLYGTVEVKAVNNSLVVTRGPHFTGDAEHWHYETFRVVWRDPGLGRPFVTFIIDARGRVSELRLEGVGTFRR